MNKKDKLEVGTKKREGTKQFLFYFLLPTSCFLLLTFITGCGSAPPSLSDSHMKAVEFNLKAESSFKKGSYKQALDLYSEALRIDRSIENTDGVAINLINIASVYRKSGDRNNALKCLDEILDTTSIKHSDFRLSEAAFMKALVYIDDGKYDMSSEWADKALSLCRNAECRNEGKICNLKSRIALLKKDPASAIRYGEAGLDLNKKYENAEETANSLRALADARHAAGEYADAGKLYEDALVIDKPLGLSNKIAADLMGIGNTLSGQGKSGDAMKYYQRALSASKNAGDEQTSKDVESKIRDLKQKNR